HRCATSRPSSAASQNAALSSVTIGAGLMLECIVVSMQGTGARRARGRRARGRPAHGKGAAVADRLISADSHVAISLDAVREPGPANLHEMFDGAIAAQGRIDAELRGGRQMSLGDFDMEASRDPGYREAEARLAAMDRDGVDAEVLYSEVSAFRAFGL